MTTAQILECLKGLSVLVVGDLCLDRWCRYDPKLSEPSRETGLPRIAVVSTETTPGAAGTVASNLVSLGVRRVGLLGIYGGDGHGTELIGALAGRGIDSSLLVGVPGWPTFTYTKLINSETGLEDRPRVDFVPVRPIPEEAEAAVLRTLRTTAGEFDVILVSDQAETDSGGLISSSVRYALSALAQSDPGLVIWVDSRKRGELFRSVVVKLNEQEAGEACGRLFGGRDYEALRRHIGHQTMIVTLGPEGALVVTREGERLVPTLPVDDPVDICGAGDSFNAGAATALAVSGDAERAAAFGNLVASVTIMKPGTGTASGEEVLAAELRRLGAS
jgi:rfaE bifunctional protein kinase chain/domain